MLNLQLPKHYNYIGVFLTLRCNLGCNYCLNKQGGLKSRQEIPVEDWIQILRHMPTREDLPITLQGGEPTMYRDFYYLVWQLAGMGKKIDLLTNGMFDAKEFIYRTDPAMFRRKAPYAPIRFSYHYKTPMHEMLDTAAELKQAGYPVGVWGIDAPGLQKDNWLCGRHCQDLGIDFRLKEYLNPKAGYGTYKYPEAVRGKKVGRAVWCKPSELLFAPDGKIFPCHHYLYTNTHPFTSSKTEDGVYKTVRCSDYGNCNPCDVKLKTNRLQEAGHCSVEIDFD